MVELDLGEFWISLLLDYIQTIVFEHPIARYKMIVKNIPSSNEFIIAIQKYDDFTSWENTLANKRLLTTTTILNGGNTLVTYDNGSGVSETVLGNRPNLGRGGAITFHSLEYSKITNIGLKEIVRVYKHNYGKILDEFLSISKGEILTSGSFRENAIAKFLPNKKRSFKNNFREEIT